MPSPYVYERQSEYWTSRQIEDYFLDAGIEILTFPVTQYNERLVPADFLFFHRQKTKLFGFQYKALYRNGTDYWPINAQQHQALRQYPWVYYCLSELRNTRDWRSAQHFARIISIHRFDYQDRIYTTGESNIIYSRWGAFVQGLEQCRNGVRINTARDLSRLLQPNENPELVYEFERLLVDLFITDFETRHVIHLSPFLRNIPNETDQLG